MKWVFLLLLMPFTAAWGAGPSQALKVNSSGRFIDLVFHLPDPAAEYRPAPLWVWNADMNRQDIDRMLGEFKKTGFGGAFIHPRAGLVTEYLSVDWFELYRYATEKARSLGLEIWIYDENSYPSGFAGGHVPAQMPKSFSEGSGLALVKDSLVSKDDDKYFICLKRDSDGSFSDITEDLARHAGVRGEYYKYRKTFYARTPWYGGYSYVDLLMPGVTEKFLDVTMGGYEKTFGNDPSKSVKGIFSDEPHIGTHGGTRWTPTLFDDFSKRWNYDLKTCLPELSEETGNWRRTRHNYLSTLTRLFIERWAEPMAEYCRRHNLIWTGHYWEHDWPRLSKGGDSMSMYARHQMPAIDMLFNQFDDNSVNAQFGNIRSVKELESAATQTGARRTLSESYGGGGWDETFEDFKRLADWEYALGVNFLCQHLSHTTIRGARKFDYPPVFSPVSPWWDNYRALNDYFSRLSLMLSHGRREAKVLVIEPTTTIWCHYSYTRPMKGSKALEIGQAFQDFICGLENNHLEYDLGSELMMEDYGSAEGGKLKIGEAAYTTVVIPPLTENLNKATFELLRKFIAGGGEIITFSDPFLVDGIENNDVKDFFKDNDKINRYGITDINELSKLLVGRQKIRIEAPGNRNLYHNHRGFADGELVFIANSSTDSIATGKISSLGKAVYLVDPSDGSISQVESCFKNGETDFRFSIPPAGSLTLFFAKRALSVEKSPISSKNRGINSISSTDGMLHLNPTGSISIIPEHDNILILDFCRFSSGGRDSGTLYYAVACDSLFARHNMKNPWDSSIQYRRNTIEKDIIGDRGPVNVIYSFISGSGTFDSPVTLTQEFPDIWKVKVNGEKVEPDGKYIIDPRFGSYDISRYIRKGENKIELYADSMSIYTEIAPLYITGKFRLESIGEGWRITEVSTPSLGSWKGQGYPCYPRKFVYSRDYEIKKVNKGTYLLKPGKWRGTVAEAFVNGRKAGVFITKSDMLDITSLLKNGTNRIEVKVTGSNQNLYGPHFGREKGLAAPPNWKKVKHRRSGNGYDLEDYGLFTDLEILVSDK